MNLINYHIPLATYFASKPHFFDGDAQRRSNIRKCSELPWQQTNSKLWDEVTETLCDLNFIQAKACAKQTYDLVKDYHFALDGLPEYHPEKEKERKRQERLEKFTHDLIACAERKISRFDLEVPESITPWTQQQIDAEIERIKNKPTRADKLKDFINFLGQEATNLQNYASEFAWFTHQQAWNFDNDGPVGIAAGKLKSALGKSFLHLRLTTRPSWKPFPQSLQILKGHTDKVTSVALAANGKRAISGSWDKTCILWDLQSGEAFQTLKGHNDRVTAVALTADGKQAISGSHHNTCILWDLQSGEALQTLKGHTNKDDSLFHTNMVTSVALTSNGKRAIFGSSDSTLILWDLQSGEALQTLKGHTASVTAVALTADGKQAISSSEDRTYILWDLQSGETLGTWKSYFGGTAVALTADGKRAISGSEDRTRTYNECTVWDINKGEVLKKLWGHSDKVTSVALTADGKKAISGSEDRTCILWDLQNGEALQTLKGHTDDVISVALTADGKKAISGSEDKTCILWDLQSGEDLQIQNGHTDLVTTMALTADGKRAISNSRDNTCIVWDIKSGEVLQTLRGHSDKVTSVAFTADGKRAISGSRDNTFILWDLHRGELLHRLNGHPSYTSDLHALWLKLLRALTTVALTADGKRAITGSWENTCILWDLQSGEALQTLKGHTDDVISVALTADGKKAISGSEDKTCILWSLQSGEALQTLKGHTAQVTAVALTADGKRAISGSRDKTCILWSLQSGEALQTLKGHTAQVTAVALTADGKKAISGSEDKTCILWDLQSGEALAIFCTNSVIMAVSFSPNGPFLGCSSSEVVFLSADRELLYTGTAITTLRRIWDFELNKYQSLSADCPLCGHRFAPPKSVLATIEEITKKAGLRPEQSTCLELPNEVWEEPGLLSECPNCGEKLKYNPFIAGGD